MTPFLYLFIWNEADSSTKHWHSGAGVVIIAESLVEARRWARENNFTNASEYYDKKINAESEIFVKEPDLIIDLQRDLRTQAFVFPNAGCC